MLKMRFTETVVLKQADVLDPFGVIFVDKWGWGARDVRKIGYGTDGFSAIVWEHPDTSGSNLPILRLFWWFFAAFCRELATFSLRLRGRLRFEGRIGDKG